MGIFDCRMRSGFMKEGALKNKCIKDIWRWACQMKEEISVKNTKLETYKKQEYLVLEKK